MNLEKIFKIVLLSVALVLCVIFFIGKNLFSDVENHLWRFGAAKVHLASDFAMPYFTPARAGGFHLAADTSDLLFSVYMAMNYAVPNIRWAIKITNFLLSIVLALGIYFWLPYFSVVNSSARIIGGLIVIFSGYWVWNMAIHPWAHGLAYLPWTMICMEELLKRSSGNQSRKIAFCLTGLLFLLINSGYYWLQVAVPVIAARIIIELFWSTKEQAASLKGLFIIGLCAFFAILLSFPRLGGIYAFQLTKFPRLGGEVGAMQVIGRNKEWIEMTLRSFFDGRIITQSIHSPFHLGFFWDYTNFIGIAAIPFIIIGLARVKPLFKNKIFIALFLASLFQLAMTRTTHASDLLRFLCPLYKQITWYWRGSAILLLFLSVLIAWGYQKVFTSGKKWVVILGVVCIFVNLAEITYVQMKHIDLSAIKPPLSEITHTTDIPPKPFLKNPFAPYCMGYIFGYGNEKPKEISVTDTSVYDEPVKGDFTMHVVRRLAAPEANGGYNPTHNRGYIFGHGKEKSKEISVTYISVYHAPVKRYFNMNDVRRLAAPEANGGYYLNHPWPLWPRKDAQEFEKFINYKQVVTLPAWLKIMNIVSAFAWIIYLIFGLRMIVAAF